MCAMYGKKALGTVGYMGGVMAVPELFCWSWGQLVQYNQEFLCDADHFIHYTRVTYSDHAPARNSMARDFLGDWLLQLDTDHMFDPDILARMLRVMKEVDADVLSAVYQMKTPPYAPVLYQENEGCKVIGKWPDDMEVMEIASGGGGCLLVRRHVFDRINTELKSEPFTRFEGFSEDHSFFRRCRELGVKTYAAMHIECNHLKVAPISLADYQCDEFVLAAPQEVRGFKNG